MRQIASDYAGLGVTEIARTVCELLDWKRPGGGLKNHECRLLLEQLRDGGQLTLPAVRALGGRGPRRLVVESLPEQAGGVPVITGAASGFHDLELMPVAGAADGRAWRECIQRYHYLGCPVPYGAQLRYWIQHRKQRLGCLLWTSPAWRMKPRDEWIGWTDQQRRQNLQRIVNNGRFLILPAVKVTGLASMVLARCARQLPGDWEQRYGYRPWLLETLVEVAPFRGTCYRAANWIRVGQTAGRGRMDRLNLRKEPVKDIFVYPLVGDVQQLLRR